MYKCPRCNGSLTTHCSEGIDIEICISCGGIWLDANELRELAERPQTHPPFSETNKDDLIIDTSKNNSEKSCPKCSKTNLNTFVYGGDSGIELDRCPQCEGLWFDKNELDQIAAIITKNREVAVSSDDYKYSDQKTNKYIRWIEWISKFLVSGQRSCRL